MEIPMSAIPYPLDPMGSNLGPYFELVVKPGILGDSLTYGFTPYWNTGGYCKVVDWGDGSSEDATASGTSLTHTYTAAGTYTIRIKADCYRYIYSAIMVHTHHLYIMPTATGMRWGTLQMALTCSKAAPMHCLTSQIFQKG